MKHARTRKLHREFAPTAQELVPASVALPTDRRHQHRYAGRQHVAIHFRNLHLICDLADLSESGAKLCVLDGVVPNVDEKLSLMLFDGTVASGRVSWLRDKHLGMEFDELIKDVEERLSFEDLGSQYFSRAVKLQKATHR